MGEAHSIRTGVRFPSSRIVVCLLLAVLTFAVYWQVAGFGFTLIDDQKYVSENNIVLKGITLEGIRWSFATVHASNWHPLTWISHMADVEMFGLKPGMFHIMNVLFHIINSILLFIVLEKMTGSAGKSAVVAALFALHPLHVESVAWISERKDVLSALFWLITMLVYLRYVQSRTIGRYSVVAFAYVLGLLAKPMLVTLPFVLLLMDFWPLKRINLFPAQDQPAGRSRNTGFSCFPWQDIFSLFMEKIPLLLLASVSSCMTYYAQHTWGAVVSKEALPLSLRLANAVSSYMAYLVKMVWPFNLAAFYPYPDSIHLPVIAASVAALAAITVFSLFYIRRMPYLITGWLWYLGTLVPVIGIVQVGSQSMADRYTYIPLIGIFIMTVWGCAEILTVWKRANAAPGAVSAAVILLLSWLTWNQVSVWKDGETLFTHAALVTGNNDMAHLSLGSVLLGKGDVDGAIRNYQEAVRINPYNADAYISLGDAFAEKKDTARAIEYYGKGLERFQGNAYAHTAIGTLLQGTGRKDEAFAHFQEALRIEPGNVDAHNNLGNLMLSRGIFYEAIRHYTLALGSDPHQAEVYNNLGTAFICQGNIGKAIECYQAAIREKPGYAEAAENLRKATANRTILSGLLERSRKAAGADPGNPALHKNIGDICLRLGEYEEAVKAYQKALSLKPDFIQAKYGIVLVYSNNREYDKALDVLQGIRQEQPENPEIYYNIACVYSRQNKVDDSVAWLKKSIEKGFRNINLVRTDPDLECIRSTAFVRGLIEGQGTVRAK